MLDAKFGKGCQHCEIGVDIEKIESDGYGRHIRVCLECCMEWFPGKDITWWEANHAPFRDHVSDRIRAARERELKAWEKWIEGLPRKEEGSRWILTNARSAVG